MAEKPYEHTEYYDIASLNAMAHERGKISWNNVVDWCNRLHANDLQMVRELTTGDRNGPVRSDNSDIQAWLYYLYCLGARGAQAFTYYFREIYCDYFEPQGAHEDIDIAPPQPRDVFARLLAYRNQDLRPSQRAAAFDQLMTALFDIQNVAAHFRISLTNPLLRLDDYSRNPGLLLEIDLAGFHAVLQDFHGQYSRQKKGMAKKILRRPLPANMPIFLGIRAEHAALGKSGKSLDEDAAKDFATFLIGVSFRDTHQGDTITEWMRKGFRAVMADFPLLKALSEDAEIEEHEIAYLFENVSPELIATLIGYLRMQITTELTKGVSAGIKSSDIPEVRAVLHSLEKLLASRMAKMIVEGTEGNATKMAEKASEVVQVCLRKPLAHVSHDMDAAAANLKGIPAPKHEEGEKHKKLKKGWKILAEAAAVFSAVEHVFDSAGLIRSGRKDDDVASSGKTESKKEASPGHH